MSSNDDSAMLTKVFKNRDSMLHFLAKNYIPQFTASQQECNGAWRLSFPKELYPTKQQPVNPEPDID